MKKWIVLVAIAILAAACDKSRVYEKNTDMPDNIWEVSHVPRFEFDIADVQQSYNIYINLRNSVNYPFSNIYVQYQMFDSEGNSIEKDLQSILLFDTKSGKPYGNGLGDIFDHRMLIKESYVFDAPGQYVIELEQYMRMQQLPMLLSVGIRIEKSVQEEISK